MSNNNNSTAYTDSAAALTERMDQVAYTDGTVLLGKDGALDDVQWHRGEKGTSFVALTDEIDRASREGDQPMPAILIVFGKIKADRFFLTSTGGYVGPTAITPSLAAAKGNAVLAAPGVGKGVDDDFSLAVQQLDLLRDNAASDAKKTKVGAMDGAGDERGIRLRHIFFEAIPADAQAELRASGEDPNEALGPVFMMRNWHCPNPSVQAEMQGLLDDLSHRPVPIAAYDIHGDIIAPADYQQKLAGAVVEARFTLTHVKIKGAHYFSADIAQLDILLNAPVFKRASPLKRAVADFSLVSPKKKTREM